MQTRFKKNAKIFDIVITAVAGMFSVGIMLYGVLHLGLRQAWPELVLNIFYIACLVMIWMYFFNYRITSQQFNYWCSISVGMTVLLRDILFAPPLAYYSLHLVCLTLSVLLLCMLTFFYARKNWKSYTKRNLWAICVIDMIIAALYNLDIYLEPVNEYTNYMLTEIWIRPTITYGLVACFVTEIETVNKKSLKRSPSMMLFMLIPMLTLVTGCQETAPNTANEAYKTLRVEKQNYTLERRFVAKIEGKENVDVCALIGGTLKKVCVKEGSRVKKGQPLFIIDQAPYIAAANAAKAKVRTARAALSTAQLNLDGKEKLYAQQMVGENDLLRARYAKEDAAAQLEAAQAELASARSNLNYTTIYSPVDGTISILNFLEDNVVFPTSSLPIATVAANKHIYAYVTLSEELLVNLFDEYGCSTSDELLKKLPPISLYTIWGEKLPQEGHIDAVSGEADISTGSVLIRASFDNPSEMFRNGSNGYVVLPTTKHGVFVIPQDATIHIQDKCFVYRIVDGRAVSTEVKGISANDEDYVVSSGLNDGDVIIAEKAGMVTEGMAVAQETGKKEL